uniref:Transketolase n=1 Tax=Coremiostelium polycephalum TaxID=142831 RepID=A0A1L2FUW2_9MYCE|nr:transketolase [Coremiostelium polycephalum]
MTVDLKSLERACSEVRGLSMDAVAKAASGHLGLPLGSTEIGAALFGHYLNYNPQQPHWLNRDYFVLSAGHGSMFLYSWLHLAGYDISLDDVKNFRQLHSKTPGHPEFHDTPGVEATTGPLGQGVANGVGIASACKMAAARFNTDAHKIFDQKVVVLCGDGCLQEGVAQEALSFAGHHRLDNYILFYDSNDVTLDAMAIESQSEDTAKKLESLGFEVQVVQEGNSIQHIMDAYQRAATSKAAKPHAIICKTLIAKGIPEVAGTNKGHGEAGVKFVDAARKALGLPEEKFFVSQETRTFFAQHKQKLVEKYNAWESVYSAWRSANPKLAELLDSRNVEINPHDLLKVIPEFSKDAIATRKAGSDVLQPLAQHLPLLISGSADLHGSTLNYIKEGRDFTPSCPAGRNIKFGIREHAMGGMMNGFAYHGIFKASGATFLVFSDYLRPSIRLAALSHLPVTYIFTHDSVAVGEDGPTHQPVETVSGLRMIPNLHVIRPGDHEETAGAFAAAFSRRCGPTLLALTRQNLPNLSMIPVETRREGVLKGGYIAVKETGALKAIIIATGSELQHAVEAAKQAGEGVRVVSMPCTEIFDKQSAEYKESVLPSSCRKRIAIEAGVTQFWYKYVGLDGHVVGIDRFGLSAPGATVLKELGMTPQSILNYLK